MDPCPFVRILIGNLAVQFPAVASKPSFLSRIHPSSFSCYCKIKLKNFPNEIATVPVVQDESAATTNNCTLSHSLAACFNLNKAQIEKILEHLKSSKTCNKVVSLRIAVYTGSNGTSCVGVATDKLVGKVSVTLDLRGVESRPSVIHNGWVGIGENRKGSQPQLYLTVKAEPDPRFVFQFDGEPECSPQVFQVQGSIKQAVFTCKFGFRNSNDRNLVSRASMNEENTPKTCMSSFASEKEQSCKERKGWSITIHDLSGSPVAMASMVTPFVPSPGSDRVSRSNPGAWLILRPENCTWKPWGRLEAWREPGNSDLIGYRFDLLHDTMSSISSTTTIASANISISKGGKFSIDMTNGVSTTPGHSPQSSCDFGSGSWSGSGSIQSSGSGSDFAVSTWPQFLHRGFVASATVERVGKCSKPEVEIGVHHVTCTEDAAAFVALAAAMDLSVDACILFSQKLRKELRQQSQQSVV